MTHKKKIGTVAYYVVGILIAILAIIPFLWMVSTSLKARGALMSIPIEWIPKEPTVASYVKVFSKFPFFSTIGNSLFISVTYTFITLISASMAAFAFAKIKFRGRDVVFLLYLSTMMIPSQITIIPKFVIFDRLGMIGTHWTMILPGIFTITGTFLMPQYFTQIPDEVRESAKIDGASEFTIWRKIMLPMAKSSMAALAMMVFLWTWNNYLDALVFLPNWRLYTIPLALTSFIEESTTQYHLMMAAASSAIVPVVIVFIIGNKQFVKGITAGAVKG